MDDPVELLLFFRPLDSSEFDRIPLEHQARGVYRVSLPLQYDDFEYYIEAETSLGAAVFLVIAPELKQTIVVVELIE